MDLLYYGFILLTCITIGLAIEALWGWWFSAHSQSAKRLKKRLFQSKSQAPASFKYSTGLLKDRRLANSSRIEIVLRHLPGIYRLQGYLAEAGLSWSVTRFFSFMLVAALGSFLIAQQLPISLVKVVGISIVSSLLPLIVVNRIGANRLRQLEQQLPEAADFISRSLRAGHAFSMSLQMLVHEMPNPIAIELKIVSDEISYGLPLSEALQRLCARVPLPDLHYLVVAILVQRETGGNLAELLTKVAQLVRQRLKLQADVRVLSAEGRLSAWILCLLPPLVALFFCVTNPDYLQQFIVDPAGSELLWLVGGMQLVGVLIMRHIVRIRV